MVTLLPFVLPALLFLALQLLWVRPGWLHLPAGSPRERDRAVTPTPAHVPAPAGAGGELFSLAFVRRRIDAITAELARLDRDETIFALAFRLHVARAAHEALLADAERLAAVQTLELELCITSVTPLREELDV